MVTKSMQMRFILLLAIGIAVYAVVQYGIVGMDKAGLIMQKVSSGEIVSSLWKVILGVHIVTSIFALVLGPFLLMEKVRHKNKVLHKRMGYVYTAGVIGGGVSGLYLAYYATGGVIAQTGFGMLAIVWFITVILAVKAAIQKKIAQHRRWTMMNYSLTFAAVTLRIWLGLFMLVFGLQHYDVYYAYTAWICWVPNLLFILVYIKRKKSDVY
ncbi:Predicted membrane protein [Terribacillus aidingensis]|uniref:Predicted membrane protein n=1 Tax=Terribacillus aidingensis TaxID=586416 RepID=A0A285P341_9BACI|nr:DUF2306 domain-containing protein [Terribacillus aidingensis]SNZ15677.1 Predicted membrane protein [Terribacillus aidingensis]